jgi:hypothetical protein
LLQKLTPNFVEQRRPRPGRNLHLDGDWIEISINGKSQKIYGAGEEIDDRVGPMVNRSVVADVLERSDKSIEKRYSLRDLQLEEDLL